MCTHIHLLALSAEILESITPQLQQAHLEMRSLFPIPFPIKGIKVPWRNCLL